MSRIPLAHKGDQSERTLRSLLQDEKGVDTELVPRYSSARKVGARERNT